MEYLQDVYFSNLSAVINTGGFLSIGPGSDWRLEPGHRFNQNKFYFITRGSCRITIDGVTYRGTPGTWFFIPAGAPHGYHNDREGDFQKYWMHFDLHPAEVDLFRLLGLPYMLQTEPEDPCYGLFQRFNRSFQGSLTERLTAKACLLELLARYIQLAQVNTIQIRSRSDDRIDAVLRYIHENLRETLTNEGLAKLCHVHPNHFIRFFRERTGQTPARYIRAQRMEKAMRLLVDSDLSISEIMDRIGCEDLSYFSKQFKQFYAMPPREFRALSLRSRRVTTVTEAPSGEAKEQEHD